MKHTISFEIEYSKPETLPALALKAAEQYFGEGADIELNFGTSRQSWGGWECLVDATGPMQGVIE